MTPIARAFSSLCCAALLCGGAPLVMTACDTETATHAAVQNGFAEVADGGDRATRVVVYKTWWVTTLFTDPVPPATTSAELRAVPERDTAYALLAPGWASASGVPPTTLIPVRSREPLAVSRGEVLHILVSDGAFMGNCAAGQALTQDDADFITHRIFPGEFAKRTYDAKTCTSTPLHEGQDGGADGEAGGASDGEAGADGASDAGPG